MSHWFEAQPRSCPACDAKHPSISQALRCWYRDDPETVSSLSFGKIAKQLKTSNGTISGAWRRLARDYSADREKEVTLHKNKDSYLTILNYLRRCRRTRTKPRRGWQTQLATELGISRQRVHQLVRRIEGQDD